MSESVLKALMRLFAILADINRDRISDDARHIVESYLRRFLSKSLTQQYIRLFDDFYSELTAKSEGNNELKRRKRTASNSVKVLGICQQINVELHQKEKTIVLLRIIEFAYNDGNFNPDEDDFIQTIANVFSIGSDELEDLKSIVTLDSIPDKLRNSFLAVSNNIPPENDQILRLQFDGIIGEILILYNKPTQTCFLKLFSDETFLLRGIEINKGVVQVFDTGAILKTNRSRPLYYSEVLSFFVQTDNKDVVHFSAHDVEYCFANSSNGLHRFNFLEKSGNLVGIMGGSGVGKSTLLNILNGSLPPAKGEICINGHNIYTESKNIKGLIGFVPQDDLLFEELTVFQNLFFNAKLCFGSTALQDIENRVRKVLDDLGLNEIQDLKVGSPLNKLISGGQRKRLNIALEIIREPIVMFVDEPTSGLSSNDSEAVMLLLKELALKGKLVIVNIHQPSSDIYKLFDRLLVMDKGGYVIYNGNPIEALSYFKTIAGQVNSDENECPRCGNVNPEQLLQIVESKILDQQGQFTRERKVSPLEWFEFYEKNIEKDQIHKTSSNKLPTSAFNIPSKFNQFKVFFHRNWLAKASNNQYLLLNLLEAPLLALILAFFTRYAPGDIYTFSANPNFPAFLFMCVIVPLFLGMTVSAEEIIKDRKILQRERFLNLSRLSYLSSKTGFLIILSAIQSFTFVIIANAIFGIHGMLFGFWITLFGLSVFANLVGLNISAGLNSVVTIYIIIPLILVPQLMLSGVIIRFDQLNKQITHDEYVPISGDFMASRWAYEAMAVYQFCSNDYEKPLFNIEMEKSTASYYSSFVLPELRKNLNICRVNVINNKAPNVDDLLLIQNEFERMQHNQQVPIFSNPQLLEVEHFDSSAANTIEQYIKMCEGIFVHRYEIASRKSDSINLSRQNQLDKNYFIELKQASFNDALAELMLNRNDVNKIVRSGNHFIRRKDPIYTLPENQFGRSQFYAPIKRIGNWVIPTFWFNNGVIWLMSLILFLTLYFDILRKLIEIRFHKREK